MGDFFQDLPKAELHVHLEGSLDADVLARIAPGVSPDEVDRAYRFSDFAGFIEAFKWAVQFLRTPADYGVAARGLVQRLAADNVRYAEVTLAAGVVLWKGLDFDAVYEEVRRATQAGPVEVWWVLDAIRHFGPDHVMEVARLAVARAGDGVVAFGIGGDEARGAASDFRGAFSRAREAGLKLVPHAGETTTAASVREAVEAGAHRIGHGIRAVDDPALLRCLRERNIPLEICLSSNVATGAVARIEDHPVRQLFDAGVPIVLNTDDPAMFRTTLSREYEIAVEKLGFRRKEIEEVVANGFRFGWRGEGVRALSPPAAG